ncbi:HAMP domain-containing histidine kinase [Bacillus sp. BGMRC 2118]|nr:HAMP domain-containing histidine kinase [Bacillus sp. BGMRC 2118]
MKLGNKINLYTTVMFLCLLILLNTTIYFTFSKMMYGSELERINAEVLHAHNGISQQPVTDILRAYMPIDGMLQVVNGNGRTIAAVVDPDQQYLREINVIFYQKQVKEIVQHNGVSHAFVAIPIIWSNGEIADLQVTRSLQQTDEMIQTLRIVLFIVTLLATIPVLISSKLLSNLITYPITSMIQTMREIRRSGQFKRLTLSKKSKDELYQMAETFNEMIDLLEVNYEKQGQFVSNASHELKTPLTVIESYASLLKRRGREKPELFEESVHAIHSEAIRMKELIEQLLLLARNHPEWNVVMEEINLTSMIAGLTRSVERSYQRKIVLHAQNDIMIQTDVQKVKQLFYILMDNARKYSDDIITVSVELNERQAIVEIKDRGIGIPSAELELVFDRFYRVDQARTRKTGGFGLGLSLARDISEAIGATLQLESTEGMGTTARIILPLSPSQ